MLDFGEKRELDWAWHHVADPDAVFSSVGEDEISATACHLFSLVLDDSLQTTIL